VAQLNTTKHCAGCKDNFYNGNNELGVKRCWMLADAEFVKRLIIPVDLPPPYKHLKPRKVLNCYHEHRCVSIKPEALTSAGYWK
jgi:hypothetical protein